MRIAVTKTWTMYVEVPDDEEHRYLVAREDWHGTPVPVADTTDLSDAAERFANIAGSSPFAYSDGWLSVERDEGRPPDVCEVLDGTAPERAIWRSRSILNDAIGLLGRTRYREGDCREIDASILELRRVEERLRVAALAAEGLGPDHKPLDGAA